jgi:ABC-2 type transport system ATP-binding protein
VAVTAGDAIIKTDRLSKQYGDTIAVDRLDLRIRRGEVFGLLGPNGAGKTTTILMLLGLTEPTSGAAEVDGLSPARDALSVKARVGYLPDDVGFYDELTARDNLRFTAALNRIRHRDADERVDMLLTEVGLADVADHRVRSFSRGMRQRLGLADALVKQPTILILDEPTVNIDPEGVRELLLLVERLRTEQGVTVLLSSHLLHQVEQVCDRIGIFVNGRLVACGTIDQLAAKLADRWVFTIGLNGVDDAAALLSRISGVKGVRRAEGRWTVTADRDVRGLIQHAVIEAGGELTHLSRDVADLDAIYQRYFREERRDGDRVA